MIASIKNSGIYEGIINELKQDNSRDSNKEKGKLQNELLTKKERLELIDMKLNGWRIKLVRVHTYEKQ